ncbi:FkbM family methyltransferase [Algibacter mikhailovii]|uniref:Methyltransferase FkbM domain-containing protein n=1 Tax=Algibacter mikhailovii TaxID=425498 RepID=A0A918RED1_9FLAO|nr:FkbM family methyltransferase [Algibacter mikhailovii]GGZ93567.1 hypothetical protein GCM10007028_34970 [Algibacter mikhailovii]
MIKTFLHNIILKLTKIFYGSRIVSKPYINDNTRLFYEISQHLNFLFQGKIKYENNLQQKIKGFINRGDVVFDIGGNIGQYALMFSELVGNKGKVFSFEPDYKNFSFLQFNTNINKKKNLFCLNNGIGAEEGILEFYRDSETGGRMGSFKREFVKKRYKGFKEQVEIIKCDSLINKYGIPNFVKIDVEGFEYEVLKGLKSVLKETIFFIEVREETKEKVFQYFKHKNYTCYWIDFENKLIKKNQEIPGFANLIFFPPNKTIEFN